MKYFIYFGLSYLLLFNSLHADDDTLSLEQVWDLVVDNHEEVKALYLNNYQASLQLKQTLQRILPQVSASASVTFANPSKQVEGSRIVPEVFGAGSLTVSQPIIDLRFRPARQSAKFAKDATCYQSEFELYELLFLASETYLAVLQSKELLAVSEHQLALSQEQYAIAKERYDAGEVPVSDLLRSEEEVNRARRTLHDLISDVRIYQEHLSNFAGINTSCLDLVPPFFLNENDTTTIEALLEEACLHRQDLKAIYASIESAKKNVQVLKRANWPRLDFLGEYTLASPETLSFRNNSWTAGFWVTLPICDGGLSLSNKRNALAELAKEELLYSRLYKDIQVKVKSVYYELESARANYNLLENELAIAKENYEILSERYTNGQTSNFDLLSSLNTYIEAQANLASAHYNLMLLNLKLKKEVGLFDSLLISPCELIAKR